MIDLNFIRAREGFSLDGYVPKNSDKSGVTVGSGIDLGQHSLASFRALKPPLSEELLRKLTPFFGARGEQAEYLLANVVLRLTRAEALALDERIFSRSFDDLARKFNRAAGVKFSSLPDEFQTVIASIAHQYGNLAFATPNFWRQVTTGDYDAALRNLRNFGDAFSKRRNLEADLWERGLNKLRGSTNG